MARQAKSLSDGLSVVSFAQHPIQKDKVKSYHYNKRYHIARDCPGTSGDQESKCGGSDDNDTIVNSSAKGFDFSRAAVEDAKQPKVINVGWNGEFFF